MKSLHQHISVSYRYAVHFTEDVFDVANPLLRDVILKADDPAPHRVVVAVDKGLVEAHAGLVQKIKEYLRAAPAIKLAADPFVLPGGEASKNDPDLVDQLHAQLADAHLCRHSYVLAVGGGSVIDLVGYAAATAHRGIRLIRVPTTVLSQNDSAVGVKNGVNAHQTKNFLGTFAPPCAVINDVSFLTSLDDRDWRSGISEAVKVALLKDRSFFEALEHDADLLAADVRDLEAMGRLIHRCAELHMMHIATAGDPFEMGTSRPLDFGHWSAHQLEQLTDYELRHGEAVAIGIALDATYSYLKGLLPKSEWRRIMNLFERVGFDLYVPELDAYIDEADHPRSIFQGLEAFREHLGGELTIMLLEAIGRGIEVHEIDQSLYRQAVTVLRDRQPAAKHVA